MGELPSDGSADLRHFLDRAKPIEPRNQRGLQRRRYGERRKRCVEHVASWASHATAPLSSSVLAQFLDEQRHAIGVRKNLLDDGVGQRLALGDAVDDAGAVAAAEAAQGQHRHMRLADPGRLDLRPERDDQQHRQIGGAGNRSIEQVERCRIDPMGVLDHDQDRALRRLAVELVEKRGESHLPLLLRADCQRRVAAVRRHGQKTRHISARSRGRFFAVGLSNASSLSSFASALLARLEARGPLELRNERVEGAVRVVRGAEIAKAECAARPASLTSRVSAMRDLPMPGSPESRTTRPSPVLACSQRRSSRSISSCRPTSGDISPARRASNRLTPAVSPRTCHASTEGGSP